jgi:hypothetical protein
MRVKKEVTYKQVTASNGQIYVYKQTYDAARGYRKRTQITDADEIEALYASGTLKRKESRSLAVYKKTILVDSEGSINTERVNTFKRKYKELRKADGASDIEIRGELADIDIFIDDVAERISNGERSLELSERNIRAFHRFGDDKLKRMIINTGHSPEELAAVVGCSVEELLDQNKWSGQQFTYNGITYQLSWNYDDAGFVRV